MVGEGGIPSSQLHIVLKSPTLWPFYRSVGFTDSKESPRLASHTGRKKPPLCFCQGRNCGSVLLALRSRKRKDLRD